MPPVVVAPDSFKGTFSAVEVADALARGLEGAGVPADRCPVADGGEGTTAVVLASRGGRSVTVPVRGPLGGTVDAEFALLDEGRAALLDMAAASGLALIGDDARDPWAATTYGTGELIAGAARSTRSPTPAACAARASSCCATCRPRGSAARRSTGRRRAPTRRWCA